MLRSAAAVALLAIAPAAHAQSAPTAGAGVSWEAYRFQSPGAVGLKTISLLTVPWSVHAPLPRGFTVDVGGAFARGQVTRDDGTSASLSGLTDTQVRIARAFGRDRVVLALLAGLPTGKSKNDPGEAEVANAVAADLLPFRISNWGTGGGVGLSAAVAQLVGQFGVGLSGGYTVARSYEPFAVNTGDEVAYRPGDEARVRVAADHGVGRTAKASAQVTWQHFRTDRFGGRNLYQAGDRLQAIASLQGVLGGYNAVAWGGLLHRAHGTALDSRSPGEPVQDLWLGGAGLRVPYGRSAVTWGVDGRLFRVATGSGQGWYTGFGGTGEVPAGRVTLLPTARLRLGRVVVSDAARSGLRGVELGMSVRRSF